MARLKFKDINEWTPSSISIVDEPSHPLCHFEVYEDDEEYVKKSIDITGSEIMADPTKGIRKCAFNQINNATNGRSINFYSVSPL